jgi:hypothetical protein
LSAALPFRVVYTCRKIRFGLDNLGLNVVFTIKLDLLFDVFFAEVERLLAV